MINRSKNSTSLTNDSVANGAFELNELTDTLSEMTFNLNQYGSISNNSKESTSLTNR